MKSSQYYLSLCRSGGSLIALVAVAVSAASSRCIAQTGSNTAAPGPSASIAPTVVEIGDVYLPSSRVYVFVGKTGFGHEHGVVGQIKQGRIILDATQNAGGLVFDMASFVADTPEARKYVGLQTPTDASTQQQVNANMRGAEMLDTARFPTASVVVERVVKLPQPSQRGLVQYQLNGDLSLHGVSRPIQIVAEAEDQNGWTHLRGGFSLLQSQFGITPFSKAFGAVGVTDQLNVWGDLWIAKQRQVAARPNVPR